MLVKSQDIVVGASLPPQYLDGLKKREAFRDRPLREYGRVGRNIQGLSIKNVDFSSDTTMVEKRIVILSSSKRAEFEHRH